MYLLIPNYLRLKGVGGGPKIWVCRFRPQIDYFYDLNSPNPIELRVNVLKGNTEIWLDLINFSSNGPTVFKLWAFQMGKKRPLYRQLIWKLGQRWKYSDFDFGPLGPLP